MKLLRNFFLIFLLASGCFCLQASEGRKAIQFLESLHAHMTEPRIPVKHTLIEQISPRTPRNRMLRFRLKRLAEFILDKRDLDKGMILIKALLKDGIPSEERDLVKEYTEWLEKVRKLELQRRSHEGLAVIKFVASLHAHMKDPTVHIDDALLEQISSYELGSSLRLTAKLIRKQAPLNSIMDMIEGLLEDGLPYEKRDLVKPYTEWLEKIRELALQRRARREPKVGELQAKIKHLQSELGLIKFTAKAAVEKVTELQEENKQLKRKLERTRKSR